MRLLLKLGSFACAVFLLGALGGCATRIRSQVEAFAASDAPKPGERVFVFAAVEPARQSLETQQWVNIAAREFRQRGYVVVDNPTSANILAGVAVSMLGGRDVTSSYSIPQYGVTGYTGSTTTGSFQRFGNTGTFQSSTNYQPQYGITGYSTGVSTDRVFDRAAFLVISRKPAAGSQLREVYSAKAHSTGTCGMLSVVAPFLIEAVFNKFPQGGAGQVDIQPKDEFKC